MRHGMFAGWRSRSGRTGGKARATSSGGRTAVRSPRGPRASRTSGDGVVVLVYGGAEGIRLRPSASEAPWSLDDPEQWGEPCLMLEPRVGIG